MSEAESSQKNSPRPAAHIQASVYVRYHDETPEEERDTLERVLLFGGWEHTNRYTSSVTAQRGTWIYSPLENSWFNLSLKEQPQDRIGHSLTTICRCTVILYGGILTSDLSKIHDYDWTFPIKTLPKPVDDMWVFDGVEEKWYKPELESPSPPPRFFHSAVAFNSSESKGANSCCEQSIFVFGGLTKSAHQPQPSMLNDLWELECLGQKSEHLRFRWVQHFPMNEGLQGRFLHLTASPDSRTLILFGGLDLKKDNYTPVNKTLMLIRMDSSTTWMLRDYPTQQSDGQAYGSQNPDGYTAVLVFDDTRKSYFQIRAGFVYSLDKTLTRWNRDRTAFGVNAPKSLRDFAAVALNGTIIVFAGVMPQRSYRTMGVWNLQRIDEMWVWQLRAVPRNSPPLQALSTWTVVDDKLLFSASTSHELGAFFHNHWGYLTTMVKSATHKILSAIDKSSNKFTDQKKQLLEFADRIRWFKDQFERLRIGMDRMSNAVWQMNLRTHTWWQYSTATHNRPLVFTTSTGFLFENSWFLVTYGSSSVSEFLQRSRTESSFSLILNRSEIFIYSLERRLWQRTTQRSDQPQPRTRLGPAMANAGDRQSMLLFGGIPLNATAIEKAVINKSKIDPLTIVQHPLNSFETDVWELKLVRNGKKNIERRWRQLTDSSDDKRHPRSRFGHTALVVDSSFFVIWGGVEVKFTISNKKFQVLECANKLWILDLKSLTWDEHKPRRTIGFSECLHVNNLCRAPATTTGSRLIIVRQSRPAENVSCDSPILQSSMKNNSFTDAILHPYHIPFVPEFVFSWRSRILAVKQELANGEDDGSDKTLNLRYQDSVYLSEIELGCQAGYYSPKWPEYSCKQCAKGTFAPEGAYSCFHCPRGLIAQVPNVSSKRDCTCDPNYCGHGRCFVAHNSEQLFVECQCDFGFTGERCQLPTYIIIGAVSLTTLAIGVALLIFVRKMIKYKREKSARDDALNEMRGVWTISCSEIQLHERIDGGAPGSYGDVYRARYRDITVALKKLKLRTKEIEREFQRETELMKSMRHENIVLFLGAGRFEFDDCPFLIVEYMKNGELTSILRNKEVNLTIKQQLKFCLDAAKGMKYLHSQRPPRIHRDLKSSNLLVSARWVVKVSDFGSARLVKSQGERFPVVRRRTSPSNSLDEAGEPLLAAETHLSDGVGAALWRAPEIFACEPYGTSADVYSFGIVMWEIIAREVPFSERAFNWMHQVKDAVVAGIRPAFLTGVPRSYQDLMKECWAGDPSQRPAFPEIVRRLQYISQGLSS